MKVDSVEPIIPSTCISSNLARKEENAYFSLAIASERRWLAHMRQAAISRGSTPNGGQAELLCELYGYGQPVTLPKP